MSSGRIALLRAGLLVASLLLVLVLGETYARQVWQGPERRPARSRHRIEPGMAKFDSLFDLSKPSVRGIYKGVLHETNEMGIRGPHRTRRPGEGVVRIGVGGDSFTMGWGVEHDDTYVVRIEQQFNASSSGPRFEVLNFGLAGLNAPTAISRLVQYADLYDVDVVVYGFTRNDIEGPNFEELSFEHPPVDRMERVNRYRRSPSHLVRWVGPRLQSLVDRFDSTRQWRITELEHNYFANPAAANDFAAALDMLASNDRAREGCGAVLIHTQLAELGWLHPSLDIYEHVEALATARGLLGIQSHPAFAGMDEPPLWIGTLDPHPNAVGHELLAGMLYAGLQRLPPHCLQPRIR
jgi:lysophospholipase L1-like esterase